MSDSPTDLPQTGPCFGGGLVIYPCGVYPWIMSVENFQILNTPRLSGKTHALAQWVKAAPNRVLLVPDHNFQTVVKKFDLDLAKYQAVAFSSAPAFFSGKGRGYDVAIDNADDLIIYQLTKQFDLWNQRGSKNSVIFATNFPTSDLLSVTTEPLLGVVSPEYVDHLEEVLAEQEPYTEMVKLRDLRLYDEIVGKGRVIALEKHGNLREIHITVKVKGEHFTGTFEGPADFKVEVRLR